MSEKRFISLRLALFLIILLTCFSIGFAAEEIPAFEAQVQAIGATIQAQELAEARAAVDQFWVEHSGEDGFVDACRRIKDLHWTNGDYAEHFALCDRIVSTFPDDPLSVGIQADRVTGYIARKDLSRAAEELDRFWDLYSGDGRFVEVARRIKDHYWWGGHYAEHFQFCEELVSLLPNDPLTVGILADEVNAYVILKDSEKAAQTLDDLWARYSAHPDFVEKLSNIKDFCWQNENYALHFSICERVGQEFPDHPLTIGLLADAVGGYISRNDPNNAAEALDAFWIRYQAHPDFLEQFQKIKNVCWWGKHYDTYFPLCERFVEQFPNDPAAVGLLADQVNGYVMLKELDKAAETFERFWNQYCTHPDFLEQIQNMKNICWWNEAYGLHFSICDRVERELAFHPRTMGIRKDAVTGHIQLAELELAEDELNRFLLDYTSDERMTDCLSEIARLYNEKGYYRRGEELYRYVLSRAAPGGRSPVMILAGILVSRLGRSEDFAVIEAQVDDLIIQYADDPNLAEAVFMVGEGYAIKAQALRKSGSLQNEEETSPAFATSASVESADYRIALLESVILDPNAYNDPNIPPFIEIVLRESDTVKTDYAKQTGYAQPVIESYLSALKIWDKTISNFPSPPFAPQAVYYSAEIYRTFNDSIGAALYYHYLVHNYPDFNRSEECSFLVIHCLEQAFNEGRLPSNQASALITTACDYFESSYPEPAAAMQIAKKKQRWSHSLSEGKGQGR